VTRSGPVREEDRVRVEKEEVKGKGKGKGNYEKNYGARASQGEEPGSRLNRELHRQ
jgi:hypothetical protein